MSTSYRLRVQNRIRDLVVAASFPSVVYSDTGQASAGDSEQPHTCEVNEVHSEFSVDTAYGRSLVLKRGTWQCILSLHFHSEVSLEVFEESLTVNPPVIAADADHRQVTLYISRSNVIHPVRQQSESGTRATIAFNAQLGKI